MKRSSFFFLLASTAFILFSCKKQNTTAPAEICQTATLCMVNQTADTIWYCWGCNVYSEFVAPGQKACRSIMGPIDANSTVIAYFMTAGATRAIEVAECYVEEVIQ